MLRSTTFILFLLSISISCFAQEQDVKLFLKAWSQSDKSQTQKAEETYLTLKKNYTKKKFEVVANELDQYISNHKDDRLKSRVYMFQVLGKREFHFILTKQDTLKVAKAIKLARNLHDDQLLAEIYALAADIDFEGGYLLYNLKALELQQQIGFEYFSFVQNRFFGASIALYKTHDFNESIAYGKKCLAFRNIKSQKWDPMVYIFQLDVIGASYMALKKYDDAIRYYQSIIDTVQSAEYQNEAKELWSAIANGNIGRCLFYKGKYAEALPLINAHLAVAVKYKQWNNVAIAENVRGEYFLKQGDLSNARISFQNALSAALRSRKLEDKVKAANGLMFCYAKLGKADSALRYHTAYSTYLLEQARVVNEGKLSAMNSKILFDKGQRNLEIANENISDLKRTRNIIIVAIAILTILIWLLYNRQALKVKLDKQQMALESVKAKAEIDKAKSSLQQFRNQLIEKDQLIINLRQSLQKSALENNLDEEQVGKRLLAYVLVTDDEWTKFREDFNKVYPLFYPRLLAVAASLSAAEERLASLIFLQMNNKEIANTLGISVDSVARSKRRLKHKLPILEGQTIDTYILSLV
ncbi:tetratricopeptide repeat protein [Pedobacter ureilyticus]|uniref:Tetratricopeptide repeat protein n=1 Tax=Pedobacter ureilyticus TaxID=1393051 RepID=A0ABW9J2P9_9SPHI|nr:tetratricopeptide repeat protein [Pedobacter helvus]